MSGITAAMSSTVRTVYGRGAYRMAAVLIALGAGALLVWSSAIVTIFPTGGIFIDADLLTLATIVITSLLLGASLPLHWYAWRRSVGSARSRGLGGLAALLSIGSLSCCAPLLIPGLLSLVGVSGTSILATTVRLHSWRLPLFLAAVFLLTVSLVTGLRGAGDACRLPVSTTKSGTGTRSAA
ncbi:MAG TPA: hypothetical protein VMU65_13830 [Candidatus Saccharimonadales bacterium]|nr:hypothetical protein [Candidatus Saccharimonadales bacterium]